VNRAQLGCGILPLTRLTSTPQEAGRGGISFTAEVRLLRAGVPKVPISTSALGATSDSEVHLPTTFSLLAMGA
jgi:hypothetical protein